MLSSTVSGANVVSSQSAQIPAQFFRNSDGKRLLDLRMRALPDRNRAQQQLMSLVGKAQYAASPISRIRRDLHQSTPFQRLQRGRQRGPIHRQQGSDRPHGRRRGSVQRHQERELSVGQIKGPQLIIETPRQSACCALHMQAEAAIPHQQSCFVRELFST